MGTRVTDCGVFSLFQNIEDNFLESLPPRSTISSSLESLDVRDTFVTSESIKGALLNLPNLSNLSSEILLISLIEILNSLENNYLTNKSSLDYPTFGIKNLYHKVFFPSEGLTTPNLMQVLKMCPKVQDIICCGNSMEPNFFLQFANLNYITELTLDSPPDARVQFNTQILPILKTRGVNIVLLSLGMVSMVDVSDIGMYCPHIESLSFFENTFRQSVNPNEKEFAFNYLKKLEIYSLCLDSVLSVNEDFCVTQENLSTLLTSPFLESIHLTEQKHVNDALLEDVFKTNSFLHLKVLSFEECNITKKTLWRFLQLHNPLNTLIIRDCNYIQQKHYEAFLDYVKMNGFNLKIVYV